MKCIPLNILKILDFLQRIKFKFCFIHLRFLWSYYKTVWKINIFLTSIYCAQTYNITVYGLKTFIQQQMYYNTLKKVFKCTKLAKKSLPVQEFWLLDLGLKNRLITLYSTTYSFFKGKAVWLFCRLVGRVEEVSLLFERLVVIFVYVAVI